MQEKPQCFANASEPSKIDVKTMLESFNDMSEQNQEDFLKLHNRFENIEDLELTEKQKLAIDNCANSKNKVK